MTNQIKRASSSIGANIAEGCARGSDADFARFLFMAIGSASELENHLLLGRDLGFLSQANYDALQAGLVEVKRMLAALIQRTRGSSAAGPKADS